MSTTGNPLISIACTQCAAANARADKAEVERDEAVAARATAERVSRAILEQASTYKEMAQEYSARVTELLTEVLLLKASSPEGETE